MGSGSSGMWAGVGPAPPCRLLLRGRGFFNCDLPDCSLRPLPACLQPQMEAQQAAHEQASAAAAKLRPMPGNELLEYLKCLTPEELVSLTDCASEDVIDAMNLFVQRLMGELC